MGIEKTVCETPAGVADIAAETVVGQIQAQPDLVLGLATGATLRPVYGAIRALAGKRNCPLDRFTSFNLDEFVGLAGDHPGSFRHYMEQEFFRHLGDTQTRCAIPDGGTDDPAGEAARYEARLASAAPIALQLLGIGRNGHIGFNEPGSDFSARTRVVDLDEVTRRSQTGFDNAPPKRAITMGIGNIMEARKCLLVATGESKAEAVAAMLGGEIGSACPASALRRHGDVMVVLDTAAASLL